MYLSLIKDLFKLTSVQNKLDSLDGFRGYLAISVVLHHFFSFHPQLRESEFAIFDGIGAYIGVVGFFVLSAFLLTYRLLIDFERSTTYSELFLKITQYAIRRFFRIYLTFVIFWTLFKFGSEIFAGNRDDSIPYINGILLGSVGYNQLWTIAAEIKYYFIIPFICYAATKFRRHWILFTTISAFSILFIEYLNPFGRVDSDFAMVNGHYLHTRIPVFLTGSLLAIIYFNLKKNEKFELFIYGSAVQFLIKYILLALFLFQLTYCSKFINPKIQLQRDTFLCGLLAFLMIFLLLFCKTANFCTNLFNSDFLKDCGKYSFGIYLLHLSAMRFLNINNINFKTYFELSIVTMFLTYIFGFLWFFFVENILQNIANNLCKKLSESRYFKPTSLRIVV